MSKSQTHYVWRKTKLRRFCCKGLALQQLTTKCIVGEEEANCAQQDKSGAMPQPTDSFQIDKIMPVAL
jgi:hypothetical protein